MNKILFNSCKVFCGVICGVILSCWLSDANQAHANPKPSQSARPNLNVVPKQNLAALPPRQLSDLNTAIQQISQSWLDLAGLGKVSNPPAFPPDLAKYRQSWRTKQPNVARFLGTYRDDGQRGQVYSLSIFPSRIRDQICIIEFSPKLDQGLPDLALPEILVVSKANYRNRQLLGNRLRSATSVILPKTSFNGDRVEFLGISDRQNQPRLFAASGLPKFPDDVPVDAIPAVKQALKMAGCNM